MNKKENKKNNKIVEKNNLHVAFHAVMIFFAMAALLFAAVNHFKESSICLTLAITCFTVFYHCFIRFFVTAVTYYPLRHLRNTDNFWFRQKPFEKKLYAKIKVHSWKKHMPTYSPEKFDLRKHSLSEIIAETCRAELNHLIVIPLCFFPVIWSLWWGEFPVFLITSVISALAEIPFVVMQRYNRPRLRKLDLRFCDTAAEKNIV